MLDSATHAFTHKTWCETENHRINPESNHQNPCFSSLITAGDTAAWLVDSDDGSPTVALEHPSGAELTLDQMEAFCSAGLNLIAMARELHPAAGVPDQIRPTPTLLLGRN